MTNDAFFTYTHIPIVHILTIFFFDIFLPFKMDILENINVIVFSNYQSKFVIFLKILKTGKNQCCPMKIIVKIPMCRKSPALSCPCLWDILNHKEQTPSSFTKTNIKYFGPSRRQLKVGKFSAGLWIHISHHIVWLILLP